MGVCSYCKTYQREHEECFGWNEARTFCGVEKPQATVAAPAMTHPTEAPMANAIDDVKAWRCAKCDCTMFARIEKITEVQDGRVHSEPGQYVRCVECKDISFHPLPASQHTGWSDEAVEAAKFLIERLDDFEQGSLGDDIEDACRDFDGHVSPAIERLRDALAASSIAPAMGFEVGDTPSHPFITAKSGGGNYEVIIKVRSMAELHRAHDLVLKAFSDAKADAISKRWSDANQG